MEFEEGEQFQLNVTEFESKDKAIGIVNALRKPARDEDVNKRIRPGTFCPVIHAECRMDCESFVPANIVSKEVPNDNDGAKKKVYIVIGHYCDSPLVRYPNRNNMTK